MTSRYQGLALLPTGPLNSRPEYSPRSLWVAAELRQRDAVEEYRVVQGDRIDRLAFRILGDSRLWWVLADMNPTTDPIFLLPGEVLVVPRLEVLA